MKTRATSFLLATLAVVSFVLPALASDSDQLWSEIPAESEEIEEAAEVEETEEIRGAVLLDGEPADAIEFDILDGVCYITVSSFASLMDAEAMVEEADGTVSVSASTVVEVVELGRAMEEVRSDEEVEPEQEPEPDGAQDTEESEAVQSLENAADVVTADLSLSAAVGGSYLVANNRYLYAEDGLIDLNGRVAAPVRVLARVYNLDVGYDTENDLVLISRRENSEPYLANASAIYDGDVLYWLSRIIYAESGNQPLEGKIAVGNVVMNRVYDPKFPDNIHDVLFQKNQFTPASSGSIYREPNEESVVAAMLVIDGAQVMPDALFFNGVRARAPRGRDYVATIGDHAFYK